MAVGECLVTGLILSTPSCLKCDQNMVAAETPASPGRPRQVALVWPPQVRGSVARGCRSRPAVEPFDWGEPSPVTNELLPKLTSTEGGILPRRWSCCICIGHSIYILPSFDSIRLQACLTKLQPASPYIYRHAKT